MIETLMRLPSALIALASVPTEKEEEEEEEEERDPLGDPYPSSSATSLALKEP